MELTTTRNLLLVGISALLFQRYIGHENLLKTALFLTSYEDSWVPTMCLFANCPSAVTSCFSNYNCARTVGCINGCMIQESKEKVAACAYICEMTYGYENEPFLDLIKCMVGQKCLKQYPADGICKGNDRDAVQTITSLSQIEGDWWVVRGVNCGQDQDYPGGYDWYPCQHERFIELSNGQWINNVTYCAGKADVCTSEMIVTIANVSLPFPGVVRHEYTDAPLAPQTEQWRILSWPDNGDYLFMLWCGKLPVLEYNGGIVLSRHRNDAKMPPKVREEFEQLAKTYGLNYDDQLCPSDNTNCPF